jgi:hypothetical protein
MAEVGGERRILLALEQTDADNDLEPFIRLMGQALLDSLHLIKEQDGLYLRRTRNRKL